MPPNRENVAKYCSRRCYGLDRKGKSGLPHTKEQNEQHSRTMKQLYAKGHKMGFQKGHPCYEGAQKFPKGLIPWNKGKCGLYTHTEQTRKLISEGNKGKKCSAQSIEKTRAAQKGVPRPYAKPPHFKGEKHWNWKGGINLINERLRKSKEYKEWRNLVYSRDKYTCQTCRLHRREENIVAHHIYSWSDFPKLRFDVYNGLTLCRSCHYKIHTSLKLCA